MATPSENAVHQAACHLSSALTKYGEGVKCPPEIDVRVSWLDVSTLSETRFVPVVEVSGRQDIKF